MRFLTVDCGGDGAGSGCDDNDLNEEREKK